MDNRISQLIDQIKILEDELCDQLHQQEDELLFQLKGKKVEFEHSIKQAHHKLKTGVLQWIFAVRPFNILTAPIIYGMLIPLFIFDILISFYQASCFPIYKINKVHRGDYLVFDRRHLAYLNVFERLHCIYCSYANGLIAYAREILSRTELYFCPIKHAHKIIGSHHRYPRFFAYGDAENYHNKLETLRKKLANEQ
ncbi:MAG: hypothetical protein OEY48_03165 [Gammaproteobacteria bacterium]|nr:hypothetical protein [Gammaproteobacteria bacterium]MDH5591828.1 hypothetical protein [Gammaproteobacteria bacterium]